MIRQVAAFLLMLAFTAQTFNKAVIVICFYKNQSVIARSLCENKDKPKLNCEGTCQLSKKLKEEKNKEQTNPERKLENKSEILPDLALPETGKNVFNILHITYGRYYCNIISGIDNPIFHPPC